MNVIELAIKADTPLLIEGEPGIGKTAQVKAFAKKLGRPIVTMLASIREPSDFSGLPVVTDEGGVKLVPHSIYKELGPDGILFLDEISTAPPAVQSALLRVVLDKVVGEYKLSEGVRIIAAMNPPEYAANGFELAPPLANRFMHVKFDLNRSDWAANFPDYWGDPPKIDGIDELEWRSNRGLVAAFISIKPNMLLNFPNEEHSRSKAWPSPRTWDYASRIMAVSNDPSDLLQGFTGTIGEGAALEFHTWHKNLDLPNPEDVIKNYKKFNFPKRPDLVFAILSGVTSAVQSNLTQERWNVVWALIGKVIDDGKPDVAAVWGKTLVKSVVNSSDKFTFPFPEEIIKFEPIFKAAKISG